MNNQYEYSNYQKHYNSNNNSFTINLSYIEFDNRTTIMIRNIPNKYTVN